jgi:p-cumate 2,3-dioxygenase beta subunit
MHEPAVSGPPTLAEVERFFVEEAALLDAWRLDEWLDLVTEDGCYLVPPLDGPDNSPQSSIFLISDDIANLRSRVRQLKARSMWAENPPSRTRRIVSNFNILEQGSESASVTANFAVWRFQSGVTDTFVGRYVNKLVRGPDGRLRVRERKAILDIEALRPHGKLSFIL